MSDSQTAAEMADKISRRRARMFIALSGIFLTQQAAFFSQPAGDRLVDHARIGAWVLLASALLAAALTGGFWLKARKVRDLMEDDVTRANRASALTFAFGMAMAGAILLYLALPWLEVDARMAIHLIVSMGLVSALVRFAVLERRSLG